MKFLEDIAVRYPQSEIERNCKKLGAYFSFDSGKHLELLCKMAYQLYVLGDVELAKRVSRFTHDTPFPGKGCFRVWTFILQVWGLEVYILKQEGNEALAQSRIQKIDDIYSYPLPEAYDSFEQQKMFEEKRRMNFHYPDILYQKEIANATSITRANSWRLVALYKMIGCTFTGLYPNLTLHQEEIQCAIDDYISVLKPFLQRKMGCQSK